jgi:hypothetical protein
MQSHIKQDDPAFLAAATAGNWEIKLLTQPAQSPDTNLLDLSFFSEHCNRYNGTMDLKTKSTG